MEQIDSEGQQQTKIESRTKSMASSSPPTQTIPTDTIAEPTFDSPIPPPPKPRSLRSDKPQLDRPYPSLSPPLLCSRFLDPFMYSPRLHRSRNEMDCPCYEETFNMLC